MAELNKTVYVSEQAELKNFVLRPRTAGQSAAVGDIIEVPKDATFGVRTVEINGTPQDYGVIKEVLYNGKPKADQSINFAIVGDKDRDAKSVNFVKDCVSLEKAEQILPGTKWKCVRIVTAPFRIVTWELI